MSYKMELNLASCSLASVLLLFFLQGCDAQTLALTVSPVTIQEDSAVGSTVKTFAATGGTTPYTYSIVGSSAEFEVDTTDSSLLKVKAALDFETTPSYTLTIQVTDSDTTTIGTASATLTVSIIANAAPSFSTTNYEFKTLTANAPAGTTIGSVTATDANTGVNKLSSLSIVTGNTFTTFDITNTDGVGEIKVASGKTANLTSYTLTVHAIDGGTPALTATATVSIGYPNGAVANYVGLLLLVGVFMLQAVKYI